MATMGLVIGVVMVAAAIMIWKFYISPAPQPEVASKEKITAPLPEKPFATMPPSTEVVPKKKIIPPSPEKVSKPAVPPAPKVEVTDEARSMNNIRRNQEQSKNWEEMRKKTEEALKEIEKLKKEIGKGEGDKVSQEKYAKAVNELNADGLV